jgi:formamidopyrimidine-DNA glycosylase
VQGVRDLRNKEKNQINANLDTGFFRRAGHPCWVCGTKIAIDRQSNSRVTY